MSIESVWVSGDCGYLGMICGYQGRRRACGCWWRVLGYQARVGSVGSREGTVM